MLAELLVVPENAEEWSRWTFANRQLISDIRLAIQQQKGVNLTEYVLDPINPQNVGVFLQNNSQSHIDFNGVLGTQSQNLQDVDFNNRSQLKAWVNLNYLELQTACQKLGIG